MPSPLLLRNPTVARPPPRSSTTTHASYGGYRSGGFPGDERGRQGPPFGRGGGGGGLILPGRESYDPDTDSRSRLFVPGDDGARSGPLGGGGVEGERSIQNFRPPQGFMDRDPDAEQVCIYFGVCLREGDDIVYEGGLLIQTILYIMTNHSHITYNCIFNHALRTPPIPSRTTTSTPPLRSCCNVFVGAWASGTT